MRRIILFLATAVLYSVVSCVPVDQIEETANSISVTPSEVSFDMEGGSQMLTLTLNSTIKEWTMKQAGGSDWCSLARTSGKTSTSIKLTVSKNTGEERISVLEFESPGCETAVVKVIQSGIAQVAMPAGVKPGINYNEDGSVTLVFCDKDKNGESYDYAYLIGEFNEWKLLPEYSMNRDAASGCWWYTIKDVAPNKEYMFQYYLGRFDQENGRAFADPYSEILYETYDRYISNSTYPNLRNYPTATKGAVSAFQVTRDEYQWEVADYKIEDEDDLVIYELHFRDFTATGDINGALERLDYLDNLGINAIELMPVQEFSGSDSWGYNPIGYFALEKSYGTRDMYKKFIDECHKRGIAVILDVVYNHVHEDHAMAGLYFDWKNYVPTSNNPWFNVTAPHPFSVFHDWNHENQMVRDHIKQSLTYLIEEYKFDGFRFDLTKGFTNKQSTESSASNYDESRVAILKDYCSHIKSVDANAVVILEHFADSENNDLAKAGMKVWRNMNWSYRQSLQGTSGDFTGLWTGAYTPFGTYVGYMESHDEERTCFGAIKEDEASVSWGLVGTMTGWGSKDDIEMVPDGVFHVAKGVTFTEEDMFKIRGNSSWNVDAYNLGGTVKGEKLPLNEPFTLSSGGGSADMAAPSAGTFDIYLCVDVMKLWVMTPGQKPQAPEIEKEDALTVAMRRAEANAAFFFTVPGPKMIWQFGEVGYDISIEEGGRTGRKPIHWEYFDEPGPRRDLYDTYADLIGFRVDNPRFFDEDAEFVWYAGSGQFPGKYIYGAADGKRFAVVANFGKGTQTITVDAPVDGPYYNYFDKSESYSGNTFQITLKEGEFRLLVDWK